MEELEKKHAAKVEEIETKSKIKMMHFKICWKNKKDVTNKKDLLISTLEKSVDVIEKALEKAVKDSETAKQQPISKEHFQCNMCDFQSNS